MKKNKLDILLVRPISESLYIVAPLGLAYLATALRKNNFSIRILDCVKEKFDYWRFQKFVQEVNPQAIGFQVFTMDLLSVKKSIEKIKEKNPSVITIVGGAHPSGLPEQTLKYLDKVDFGFCGEAEISLVQLMELVRQGRVNREGLRGIPGLIWRDGDNVVRNEVKFIDDIDSLDFPSWDLIQPQTYPKYVHGILFKKFPIAPIIATRGCPYACTFCSARLINGFKIRNRSVAHVIEELRLLHHQYGIREIHIFDDNFTFHKDYVMSFCEELIKVNLDLSWRCSNSIRVDTIDMEMLKMMQRSGCYSVAFGIESGSNRILQKMKKGFTKEKIINGVELVRRAGLQVNGSFILGYPDETEEEIRQTIEFAKNLDIMTPSFNAFTPLPGTEAYNELIQESRLSNMNWESFRFSNIIFVPQGLTKKKLKAYQRKATLQFYLRPKILLYLLKNIKSFEQLCFIFKAGFMFLFVTGKSKKEKGN